MIPKEIERAHVLSVVERLRPEDVPRSRRSKAYVLLHGDKRLPPKFVVSLAAEEAGLGPLQSDQFGGGAETNTFLRGLGFTVEAIAPDRAPAVSAKATPAPKRGRPSRPAPSGQRKRRPRKPGHDERCPRCKSAIADLLRAHYGVYGTVIAEERLPISARLGDHEGARPYAALAKIHQAL